jgi:DNA-binding transcriptional LysR family regulator
LIEQQRGPVSVEPHMTAENWHGVELRHLAALRAVAAARSFSDAARTLGYTQSAVSGQVSALERLVGARLFVRTRGTRPLELTDAGRVLLARAHVILAQLDAARAELGGECRPGDHCVRLGWFWGVGSDLVPSICRELGDEHAQPELVEDRSVDALLARLTRGAIDLALVTLPLPSGPYEALPLTELPYTLVARRGERVAAGKAVTVDELASVPLLTVEGCRAQAALELALHARGRSLDVRKRLDTVEAVLGFVAQGLGFGLLPASALLPATLVAIPVDPRVPARVVAVAWHRDGELNPSTQRVVDAATAVTRRPQLRSA